MYYSRFRQWQLINFNTIYIDDIIKILTCDRLSDNRFLDNADVVCRHVCACAEWGVRLHSITRLDEPLPARSQFKYHHDVQREASRLGCVYTRIAARESRALNRGGWLIANKPENTYILVYVCVPERRAVITRRRRRPPWLAMCTRYILGEP